MDIFDSVSYLLQIVDTKAWNDAAPCMKSLGFNLQARVQDSRQTSIPFGLPIGANPAYGFHIPLTSRPQPEPIEPMDDPSFASALVGETAAVEVKFALASGNPGVARVEGGCLGAAKVALSGSADNYVTFLKAGMLVRDQAAGVTIAAMSSQSFLDLQSDWSACMAASGYLYPTPLDAWNHIFPGPGITAEEVGAATADLACKTSTDFEAQANAITNSALVAAVDDDPTIWQQWQELSDQMIRKIGG